MALPLTCGADFSLQEARNMVFQNLGTAPATTRPGLVYFDTTLNTLRVRDSADAAWIDLMTFAETPLVFTTDGNATGVAQSGTSNHTVDIRLLSSVANNALSIAADGGLYFNPTEQNVVADITARDALSDVQVGEQALVTDASDDPDVATGGALYVWDGTTWVKISEFANVEGFKSTYTQAAQAGALVGRVIGTLDDGDAGTPTVDVEETVTTNTVSADGSTLTLVNEANVSTAVTLVRKTCQNVTTAADTPLTITHNLGTEDVIVQLKRTGSNELVLACIDNYTANTFDITTGNVENLRVCVLG